MKRKAFSSYAAISAVTVFVTVAGVACRRVIPPQIQPIEVNTDYLAKVVQATKFAKAVQGPLGKGCGDGLTQDSDVGTCVYVLGILVHSEAYVNHYCINLPAGKTDKDMNFMGEVADVGRPFQPCSDPGAGGACAAQYSRFETTEYYPGSNNFCGRFKNWSNTTDRVVRFSVWEK